MLKLIITDAFTGQAVLGGSLGAIIIAGARRAAFSNEAGIGTAPIAHGAAKTDEPVREGLVAMLGPFVDTIIVCTLTALTIIPTGQWEKKIDDLKQPSILIDHQRDQGIHKLEFQALEQLEGQKLTTQTKGEKLAFDIQQLSDSIQITLLEISPKDSLQISSLNLIGNIPITLSKKVKEGSIQIMLKENQSQGVTVTAKAFEASFPGAGSYLLLLCIFFFAVTSLFSYCWYGSRCLGFMIGEERAHYYNYFYVATIVVGATSSLSAIISLIDGAFAVMSIPTMISAILLAPKVRKATADYFSKFKRIK